MITDVIETVDRIAAATPDQVAYRVGGVTTTYAVLKAKSDAVATAILALNLPAEQPVLVYGGQSVEVVIAFLASVKAGHAYIPVDDHSPSARLSAIHEIAGPALTIALSPLPTELTGLSWSPDQFEAATRTQAAPVLNPVKGDATFYIIFTSGTTGEPKGVQISHNNLLSFVNWMQSFQLPPQPQILVQAPYSFDLSVMSLYPTLVNGGTLQVLGKDDTTELKRLFAALPQLELDVWVSTPAFMAICLLDPHFDAAHYPQLRQIFFCGEELTHDLAEKVLARFPEVALYNTYGPTEATVAVTAIAVTPAILAKYPRLPIGYVKGDTQMTVKDGELMIDGPSVSKGYLNRPEKTKQAFTKSRYATGDLGRIDETGLVFYEGRKDFQIKLNGYRIELEEVNHYLNACPLIAQGVAVPVYNKKHQVRHLMAIVVPQSQGNQSEQELTAAIITQLTQVMMPYMVPQRFTYRKALPLTANGKVALKALIEEVNA